MRHIPASCERLSILQGWEIDQEHPIGQGGQGVVFAMRNAATGESAALKWIRIERSQIGGSAGDRFLEAQNRLLNEIAVMRRLSDIREVVAIEDHAWQSSDDGDTMDAFIRMELLVPLIRHLKEHALRVSDTATLVRDIAAALSACHQRKITHGDVKLENILKSKQGYKLSDFGIAASQYDALTVKPPGTQYFKPPEYASGIGVTVSGDLYSFGVALYVLLNNDMLPFQREHGSEAAREAFRQMREYARENRARYPAPMFAPPAVAEVVCKAAAIRVEDRYLSAAALSQAYLAAVASLDDSQRAMSLPFRQQMAEPHKQKVTFSTGRNTETYFDQPAPDAPEAVGSEPFTIIAEKPERRPAPDAPVGESPKKPPRRRLWLAVLAALAALSLVAAALTLLPSGLSPIAETFAAPSGMGVGARLTGLPDAIGCDVTFYPTGHEALSRTLAAQSPSAALPDLVPDTAYTARVRSAAGDGVCSFTTPPVINSRVTPVRQTIYSGSIAMLSRFSVNELLQTGIGLTEAENNAVVLRDAPPWEQPERYVLLCSAETTGGMPTEDSQAFAVLRLPENEVYASAFPVAGGKDMKAFGLACRLDTLLEACWEARQTLALGRARLEMYWQGELVGSVDITLENGTK